MTRIAAKTGGALLAAVIGLGALGGPVAAQDDARSCQALVQSLAEEGRVALQGVTFDFNRATLRPDSLPAMIAARDAILTLGGSWGIEGHTDNVGSRSYNQALSEARALAVRDWLVSAGVSAAHLSAQGFSFDRPVADNGTDAGRALNRRVELVGIVTPDMLGFGGPEGVDPCPDTLTPGTTAAAESAPPPPPIPDWSGAGGQEWLPFSYLMATGYGAATGWAGERLSLPPGSRPEACQALCVTNSDCAAFSFEPAGSDFVENARCVLVGYGTELNLRRDNGYLDGGTFFASGLKPDARLLTPESEALAAVIIADLAEIARLREVVRITAADTHPPVSWMGVGVNGAVPGDAYRSYLEIALPGDYAFDWRNSRSSLFIHDMADGRSGQIWAPEPGDYVLRYVIDHPTAGQHTIAEQSLVVTVDAPATAPTPADTAAPQSARNGTVEPGIDRPGMDIAQTPMTVADPLMCQALCAGDPACQAWTYVSPGLQGDQAACWTKSGVPDGFENPCCTSGVMDQAAAPAPAAPTTGGTASLSFPAVVAPGDTIPVTYRGPLNSGDWVDIITLGNDADMSGGWAWSYVEGPPVSLTAPGAEGDYSLRYVAEDPAQGRIVVARERLTVRTPPPVTIAATDIFQRCDGTTGPFCDLVLTVQDVVLTLAAGYGMTEPLIHETAGGIRADRPSFEVVRLSDGEAVILVNARQAQTVYCQDGLSGDVICLTPAFNDGDSSLAGVLFGSLTSHAMRAEAEAMGGEEGPVSPAGHLQGVWVFSIDMPGTAQDQSNFIVADLIQDAGDVALQGSFTTSPVVGPLTGLSGDLAGVIAGDTLNLTMVGPDGETGLVFSGAEYGSDAYRGMVYLALSPLTAPTGAIIRRIAGPGESWDGEPWMKGEPDGMEAALRMGQQALQGLQGDLSGEDRAMVEVLGGLMGVLAGAESPGAPAPASPNAPSPEMTVLGGIAVDGLGVDDALILFAPHLESRQ